ncbi:MAG: hypothetical protein SFZ03_01020 [Candidatus Melainabacteria bacterium]|nr:hypothetical protein [Candidatus Melainabacteria bacterium]
MQLFRLKLFAPSVGDAPSFLGWGLRCALVLSGLFFAGVLGPSLPGLGVSSGANAWAENAASAIRSAGVPATLPPKQVYTTSDFLRCTREPALFEAMRQLSGTSGERSLQRMVRRPSRILFKDLREMGKAVAAFDALSWLGFDGQHAVFVHVRHRGAPPEALAALIAHEALHDDAQNSLREEVALWAVEATVWHEMKQRNPQLSAIAPGKFPLVDRLNQLESALLQGRLEALVRSNGGYQGLPEQSPGF